jgi:hypothetical protein
MSALVKRLFTETGSVKESAAAGAPEFVAGLRTRAAVKPLTTLDIPQRESQDERSAVLRAAKAALLSRLQSEPVVETGRWSRDELYEDQR